MQISAKKTSLVVVVLAMAAAGAYAAMQRPIPASADAVLQVDDADAVKTSIGLSFANSPGQFSVPAASSKLANAKLEGYAVCTQHAEATAAQYIEVSEMLDKATTHVAEFQRAVDGVMDSKDGMTDCDFRVITAIAKVARGG